MKLKVEDSLWIKIQPKMKRRRRNRVNDSNDHNGGVIDGACYISPEGSSYASNIETTFENLGKVIGQVDFISTPVLIAGDFNATTANQWDRLSEYPLLDRNNIDTQDNKWGKVLIDFLRFYNLGIFNDE